VRILFLVPELFNGKGGIQVFNNYLVKALLELGHTLSIVSINDTNPSSCIMYPESNSFLTSHLLNITPCARKKPMFVLTTFKQVLSFKPDLILCGHVNFSPLCMMIYRIFKIPYFTFTYGVDVWNLNVLKLIGLKHSKGIVTISKYTNGVILEQLKNYSDDRIFMLYPTIVPERFKPGPKPEYLMKRWNIKKDNKIILTVARLSKTEKYKGYDKVIQSLPQIMKEITPSPLMGEDKGEGEIIPSLKYILVGSGDDLPRIKSLIRELQLEDHVILPGFVSDEEVVDYYNLCDVFVMPSKKEGFGIVFLEALACGKPVICGNKDGSVDAVLNGELGLLVDPDNVDEIAKAIVNVLKGEIDKRLLDGEYLRQRVIEEYGFKRFKQKLKMVIEKLY